jgi:hypothetical protein
VGTLANGLWLNVPGQLASVVCGVAFFFGQRWARFGMLGAFALGLLPLVQLPQVAPVAGVTFFFGVLIWLAVITSTLNKLFFKLEVPQRELQKAWDLFANNTLARAGFLLGLSSLLMWPVGFVGLPVSIVGLTRVDPKAMPPIGRKGQAIAGIVFSSLGVLASLAMVLSMVMTTR